VSAVLENDRLNRLWYNRFMKKNDTFLKDAVESERERVNFIDGFRFGFGFFIAWVVGLLLVGLVAWGLSFIIQPH